MSAPSKVSTESDAELMARVQGGDMAAFDSLYDREPGTEVSYPADAYAFIHQQIWMLEGHLRFREGDTQHELDTGDCLQLGPPAPCSFINPTLESCRYLIALTKRHA